MDPGTSTANDAMDEDVQGDDNAKRNLCRKQQKIRKVAHGHAAFQKDCIKVATSVVHEDNTVSVQQLPLQSTKFNLAKEPLCMSDHVLTEFFDAFRKVLLDDRKAHVNAISKKLEYKLSLCKWTTLAGAEKIPMHFSKDPKSKALRTTAEQLLAFDAAYSKKYYELNDLPINMGPI